MNIDSSGAAGVAVRASESLDIALSGAGSVDYYGDPKTVTRNVSGIGSVTEK